MGKKKRVLRVAMVGHKVVPSRRGGIEHVLTVISPMLLKKGIQATCYNRSTDKIEWEPEKDEEYQQSFKGVRLKTVPALRGRGISAVTASFFASIAAAFGPYDVVHYHAEGPCVFLWIPRLFGKKCVATVHGLDWKREKWNSGFKFGKNYIKFGEAVLARFANAIIVVSENDKRYFMEQYGRKAIFIPNGVEKPIKKDPDRILKKFGLSSGSYFCAVARLTQEKGIHYLIKAFNQTNTEKKLVIAGDTSDTDSYVAELKNMAQGNSNILFTGFLLGEELEELYSNAYVYVIPSDLEGMPMSLLEAMAYGNCVIGSNIPEIANVVKQHAILFEKSNVDDLREKLQTCSDNPELVKKYKKEVSDFVCSEYDWNKIVCELKQVYERVFNKQKKVEK